MYGLFLVYPDGRVTKHPYEDKGEAERMSRTTTKMFMGQIKCFVQDYDAPFSYEGELIEFE